LKAGPLKVAFFIQSEGRGHMTQALSLKQILEDAGHEVMVAFMGEDPERPIPHFFRAQFGAPIHTYLAPVFVVDRSRAGVRPWDSLFRALRRMPRYWKQAPDLHQQLTAYRPDLIINFFDLFGGLYKAIFRPNIPIVAVGHQFLFFHPQFPATREKRFQVNMIRLFTLLTSLDADLRLGLSFSPLSHLPDRRIRIVPPLLRKQILDATPTRGSHILAYILNPGYAEEIMAWHKTRSDIELHCFWDRAEVPDAYSPWQGLTFHRLDQDTFLNLLTTCRGFTCTAGFESVCEAAFLGKPINMVPTFKHTEQLCNALDAERAGVAVWRRDFDITEFCSQLDEWDDVRDPGFRNWVRSGPQTFVELVEMVARGENSLRAPAKPENLDVGSRHRKKGTVARNAS